MAGGSGDLLARLLGNKLSSMWGSRSGRQPGYAGGLIGNKARRGGARRPILYLGTDGRLTVAATLHSAVRLEARLRPGVDDGDGATRC